MAKILSKESVDPSPFPLRIAGLKAEDCPVFWIRAVGPQETEALTFKRFPKKTNVRTTRSGDHVTEQDYERGILLSVDLAVAALVKVERAEVDVTTEGLRSALSKALNREVSIGEEVLLDNCLDPMVAREFLPSVRVHDTETFEGEDEEDSERDQTLVGWVNRRSRRLGRLELSAEKSLGKI